MTSKRLFIYFLIIFLTAYPASAGGASLNKWVLNVAIQDDGTVEEIIQTEIENSGSLPVNGFLFKVPASRVTMPEISTFSAVGQTVELQATSGATQITINFNSLLEPGKKWSGRIDFRAENWALKTGSDYSINIPVQAPQAIVSGQKVDVSIAADPEIRSQVFLPKYVAPTTVEPSFSAESKKPLYNKLLQFNHIVLTWFKLNIGDVISVKGSYSSELNKIVETNEKIKTLSDSVKDAKAQGREVSEAETHLSNSRDYSNQALEAFWKNEDASVALDAANNEIKKVESILSGIIEPIQTTEGKKISGFSVKLLISILLIIVLAKKKACKILKVVGFRRG